MLALRLARRLRAAAFLTLLGLLSSTAESLVADVHDGDVVTESVAGAAQATPAPADAPREPRHTPDSPHTCHCVHAHAITLPAADAVAGTLPIRTPPIRPTERTLASVSPEPHFRPPVA